MSPSINTRSGPTDTITTLDIFPYTSPYLTKSNFKNTVKDIHTDIKATPKKLLDTSDKQYEKLDKQYEKIIELSSKFSTYEYRLDKISINSKIKFDKARK